MTKAEDGLEWHYPLHMLGQASTVGYEDEFDAVKALYEVVAEITGKDMKPAEKPRMGFL